MRRIVFSFFFMAATWPLFAAEETADSFTYRQKVESFESTFTKLSYREQYNQASELWIEVANALKSNIAGKSFASSNQMDLDEVRVWRKEVSIKFDLLRRVSRLRARAVENLDSQNQLNFFSQQNIRYMLFEINLVPYKFIAYFYEKYHWLTENMKSGFWGVVAVVQEVGLFFLIFLIPLVFIKLAKRVDLVLEKRKAQSFYKSFQSSWHRKETFVLSVTSSYVPWIFSFFGLWFVEKTLYFSQFVELTHLLPYFYYYIYYKIFRVTLEIVLQEITSRIGSSDQGGVNLKIKNTSKFLGLFLFIIYSLEAAFQSILGESLIFLTIEPFFGVFIVLLLFYVASLWKEEIKDYLSSSQLLWFQRLAQLFEKPFSSILCFPASALILLHYSVSKVIDWSSQFESVKLIYAKLLRVKYESTGADQTEFKGPGDEYKEKFQSALEQNLKEFPLETPFFKEIDKQLKLWLSEESMEQTVAIYGHQSSGKTVFLNLFEKKLQGEDIDVELVTVPPRVFTEKSFESLFEQYFAKDSDRKKVVLLDDSQNLFLSTIGGFSVYRKFLEKIEENKNVFWIASFNEYSWIFLNSVLGKNQYFRIESRLPRWTVEQIKELILQVHQKTGFKLEYDQIFRSSQRLHENVSSSENRYFYLLWERCAGNPGVAIQYWFKSLDQMYGNRLKVSLPIENNVTELTKLHQEAHFVYASIVKHENLNISEAARSTNLPRPVVKQAIYRGLEEGFLTGREGRYYISRDWIDDIRKVLKGKNLIYE